MADERNAPRRAAAGAAAVLALLGACADQTKRLESELTQLLAWLPGSYEGSAAPDAQRGREPAGQRIALVILKVYTPRLGHHVLYAQESAADDPRRVMSERMLSFTVDEKRGIVETLYTFAEPLRWRDGQEHPELFTSVVVEDVRSVPGCELVWTRAGERFTAAQDPKQCRERAGAAAGEPAAELSADSLVLAGYDFRRTR